MIEQICRIETFDVNVTSNTKRELQPTFTSRRATSQLRMWIERVLGLPSSSVSPGCSELTLPLGTPACT